ncbi:MAG: EAL domain-containing protein [Pseudomonadota bacterium]
MRRKIPAYLLYPAIAGLTLLVLLSVLFVLQSRWLTGNLIENSTEQFVEALQEGLSENAVLELRTIAERVASADDDAEILDRAMASLANLQDIQYLEPTGDGGPTIVSGAQWLSIDTLTVQDVVPGPRGGLVVATFVFPQINPERFKATMTSAENRNSLLVFAVAGTLALALLTWWVISTSLANRLQSTRIRELKTQAEKLRDDDFGERLPELQGDELGEFAAVFNDMRDKLKLTTLSRDYVDSILSSMNDAIIVTGEDGSIKRINKATTTMLGYEHEELAHTSIDLIVNTKKSGSLIDEQPSGLPREAFFVSKSGEDIPVSFTCSFLGGKEAESGDRIFSAQNITERRRAEKRIRYLARIDPLTKVPNRMQFQHLLQRAIAKSRRSGRPLCLFYLDVDGFKDINDTFGHLAGDTTLETVAERLTASLPAKSIIGRLAGDEFAVIIDTPKMDEPGKDVIYKLARSLLDKLAEPFFVQGHEVFMTASMGIAFYPRDAANVIDLIRNADAAMYSAKKSGGNIYVEYMPEMNEAAVEKLMTKSKLKRAFERDELLVHYQPKYNIDTGHVIGAEALVRWELPERGMILPSDFIPIAEESSLIIDIGEWVLDKVCEDFRFWQRSVSSPGRVSVNLSLKQLRQKNFSERISAIMRNYEVSPTSLELEITETTLMENPEKTIKLLDELYALGLHLAIDDFGTGYSSLSALQQFPISTLKIDKSFVDNVAFNKDDATIVSTVVQMGQNLNMDVVAEGVETEDQLAFLQSLGCTHVQGLLFGDPMSADDYLELLLAQLEGTDAYRTLFA